MKGWDLNCVLTLQLAWCSLNPHVIHVHPAPEENAHSEASQHMLKSNDYSMCMTSQNIT